MKNLARTNSRAGLNEDRDRAALRVHMVAMSDEQVAALETATQALGSLVDTFLDHNGS